MLMQGCRRRNIPLVLCLAVVVWRKIIQSAFTHTLARFWENLTRDPPPFIQGLAALARLAPCSGMIG